MLEAGTQDGDSWWHDSRRLTDPHTHKKILLHIQDKYKFKRKWRTTPCSKNQTIELTWRNERKLMFKSLKVPYQHYGLTQHYQGVKKQYAKKLAMITSSHHINQVSECQMICTRRMSDVAATCIARSSWWEISENLITTIGWPGEEVEHHGILHSWRTTETSTLSCTDETSPCKHVI
jgi:hypothetical protein